MGAEEKTSLLGTGPQIHPGYSRNPQQLAGGNSRLPQEYRRGEDRKIQGSGGLQHPM